MEVICHQYPGVFISFFRGSPENRKTKKGYRIPGMVSTQFLKNAFSLNNRSGRAPPLNDPQDMSRQPT